MFVAINHYGYSIRKCISFACCCADDIIVNFCYYTVYNWPAVDDFSFALKTKSAKTKSLKKIEKSSTAETNYL